jgi:threonine synthase
MPRAEILEHICRDEIASLVTAELLKFHECVKEEVQRREVEASKQVAFEKKVKQKKKEIDRKEPAPSAGFRIIRS